MMPPKYHIRKPRRKKGIDTPEYRRKISGAIDELEARHGAGKYSAPDVIRRMGEQERVGTRRVLELVRDVAKKKGKILAGRDLAARKANEARAQRERALRAEKAKAGIELNSKMKKAVDKVVRDLLKGPEKDRRITVIGSIVSRLPGFEGLKPDPLKKAISEYLSTERGLNIVRGFIRRSK